MKREITITLQYDLTTGKVNLNEIVYRLKELRVPNASDIGRDSQGEAAKKPINL